MFIDFEIRVRLNPAITSIQSLFWTDATGLILNEVVGIKELAGSGGSLILYLSRC